MPYGAPITLERADAYWRLRWWPGPAHTWKMVCSVVDSGASPGVLQANGRGPARFHRGLPCKAEHLGFTVDELAGIALNGFESAFLPWEERLMLIEEVSDKIDELIGSDE